MAIQLGCDLVHIPRIRELIEKRPNTLKKLFTPAELKDSRPEHLAGLFAAKEATLKALGLKAGQWLDIAVSKKKSGAPQIKLTPTLSKKIRELHLSISHDGDYAMACVVALTKSP